ncbi:hypothetical protein K439DRAFT_1625166 [Ramaria rubella]|nr:hypothetical protein K439DRAFT_1625166 [Ramaria rubella]
MTPESKAIVPVSDSSDVLNVILHTIYGLSCTHYSPSVSTISTGMPALKSYSFHLPTYILPSSPFFTSSSPMPASTLESYTLAAENDLHHVAISISLHLLPSPS